MFAFIEHHQHAFRKEVRYIAPMALAAPGPLVRFP